MLQNALNPTEAEQYLSDEAEEAPWCQAHWAELVCLSRRDAPPEQDLPVTAPAVMDQWASAPALVTGPREVAA